MATLTGQIAAAASLAVLALGGTLPGISQEPTPAYSFHQPLAPDEEGRTLALWDRASGEWFGLRSELAACGIELDLHLTVDWSRNFSGGLDRGSALRHLFEATLLVETEPLLNVPGGRFGLTFQNQAGRNATEVLVGDFQVFSNIDADGRTQLAQLWYEQTLLDERLAVIVGKIDANSLFGFVKHGGMFIHSSAGYSPTIVEFPTYPDPATSVNIFAYPSDWLYAGFGLYDGAATAEVRTGSRGPSTLFRSPDGLFLIGEVGLRWIHAATLPGRLGVGGWGHTARFHQFDGTVQRGTEGFYLVADQRLWAHEPSDLHGDRGLGAFFQYGYADRRAWEVDHHLGAGLHWHGPLPPRPQDAAGLMASYVHFSGQAGFDHDYELAFETFYYLQALGWLGIQADLQYIIHPGGSADRSNATVGTIRVVTAF
jgi:porin